MAKCWETRGCDEEMQAECPHPNELKDRCPSKCMFAKCDRPQHETTTDPELIFNVTIDRAYAIKEECLSCGFFLRNGPQIETKE